jgi:transcriptional regulator
MASPPAEILKGTLPLLVLKTLALEPRHGVGIADRIQQTTGGTFQASPGSLFPVLHRLEAEGFVEGEWTTTPEGRRARYYRLTNAGRRQLAAEKKQWARVALAIGQVLAAD